MAKTNRKVDVDKFLDAKDQFKSDAQAYLIAGGEAKNPAQAGYAFKNSAAVKKRIKERTEQHALDAMLAITTLSPLAIKHCQEILLSDDPKDKRAKDKIAMDVIQRTREVLPKEIRTTHEVSLDEETTDSLEALAEFLLERGNAPSIKTIDARATTVSSEDDGEEDVSGEHDVCSPQETEAST